MRGNSFDGFRVAQRERRSSDLPRRRIWVAAFMIGCGSMYIPLVRERVRIQGRDGLFLVLRVDYRREVADVAQIHTNEVDEDVPFRALLPACEDPALKRKPPEPETPPRRDARRRL